MGNARVRTQPGPKGKETRTANAEKTLMTLPSCVSALVYKVDTTGLGLAGEEVKIEIYLSNYRKVGKTLVPYSHRIFHDGAEFATMTITNVIYNNALKDSLFEMSR